MKLRLGIIGTVLLTALFAFGQKVTTDFDHGFDFSQIHTFTVTFGTEWSNPLQQQRAKTDIIQQLTAKGWTEATDPTTADATVIIHGAVKAEQSLDTFYSGGGWGWGGGMAQTNVNTVHMGTMLVDIFNTKTKKLIFRGTANDELSDKPQKNTEKLDKAVEKIFKDFPPKAK
jgi:hypothetical protein